jgi:outer membrane biogenesis lipoprotein LolB
MRKIAHLFVLLLFVSAILLGCGNKKAEQEAEQVAQEEVQLLDSLKAVLDSTALEIEQKTDALDKALEDLE